jgi:bacterioferritin
MRTEMLIEKLNEDLADEFVAIVQYTTYAAKATDLFRPQLEDTVEDETTHSQETERIPRNWPLKRVCCTV